MRIPGSVSIRVAKMMARVAPRSFARAISNPFFVIGCGWNVQLLGEKNSGGFTSFIGHAQYPGIGTVVKMLNQ